MQLLCFLDRNGLLKEVGHVELAPNSLEIHIAHVRTQENEDGLSYTLLILVDLSDEGANLMHNLDARLDRHLEVQQHRTNWLNRELGRACVQGVLDKLASSSDGVLAICVIGADLVQPHVQETHPQGFHINSLILSNND